MTGCFCERCAETGRRARADLARLAAEQRRTADELLAAARRAHDAGVTWTQIGLDLGMVRETAYRQVAAGSPVVVLRPTHNGGGGRTGNHAHAPGPPASGTVPHEEGPAAE